MTEFKIVSMQEVENLCCELGIKVLKEYSPEVIVGISRGGLVTTTLLSDILGIKETFVMRIKYYEDVNKTSMAPRIMQNVLAEHVSGKRVLLSDDLADSGKTLECAAEELRRLGAKEVRSAVLHEKACSTPKPDFSALVVPADVWIIHPWEKNEFREEIKEAEIARKK